MEPKSKFWNTDGTRTRGYIDSLVYQTRLWMDGVPWHNTFSDECTSDFSCCVPELFTKSDEDRKRIGSAFLLKVLGAPNA